MSVERSHRNEAGYAKWRAAHPGGFVFNNFGGRDEAYNILHRATCSFLSRACDDGRSTYEKVCGEEISSLVTVVECLRAGAGGWKECGICRPLSPAGAASTLR